MSHFVYLAGAINKKTDAECRDWREAAKAALAPLEALDPLRRDYRGIEAQHVNEIVQGDTEDIVKSSAVLVNVTSPSWGTAMEIRLAWSLHKPIYAFGAPDKPSPWLVFHCKLYWTIEDAISAIHRDFVKTS